MVWLTQLNLVGVYSELCLLKVLIRESHMDTNATTSVIRTKLSNMDIYIHIVGGGITKFNAYVLQIIGTLATEVKQLKISSRTYLMVIYPVQTSFLWNTSRKNRNDKMKDKIPTSPN